jgi:hypothetical protein
MHPLAERKHRVKFRVFAASALAAVALIACGGGGGGKPAVESASTTSPSAAPAVPTKVSGSCSKLNGAQVDQYRDGCTEGGTAGLAMYYSCKQSGADLIVIEYKGQKFAGPVGGTFSPTSDVFAAMAAC